MLNYRAADPLCPAPTNSAPIANPASAVRVIAPPPAKERQQKTIDFMHPDPAVIQQIEQAGGDQILSWAERILTAERLEDVFQ